MKAALYALLAFAVAVQAEQQQLFLQDTEPTKDTEAPREKQNDATTTDSSLDSIYNIHLGGVFNAFGVTSFVCQNPQGFTSTKFNGAGLEGTWHQAYASYNTDVYGCLSYTIVKDTANNSGDLPALNFNTAWTAYNTYWNPLIKGEYTKQYKLYADLNGRLFERKLLTNQNTFSYIIDTDYSTYFVEYACKQQYLDFWTIEYVDVFTKDGSMTGSSKTIDAIKTTITSLAPNFKTSTLIAAKSNDGCKKYNWKGKES